MRKINNSVAELENIVKERFGAIYLEDRPPKLQSNLVLTHPLEPNKVMMLPSKVDHDETEFI